jgi:antibiotic biosynthesis monooxygenase (ABM) superfamily enzyme
MSVTLRIIQRFQMSHDSEFLDLERQFAELERKTPGGVHGRRMRPIASTEPVNTLIWQGEFPDMAAAEKWLAANSGDEGHERLFALQKPFFEATRIELYENLDF